MIRRIMEDVLVQRARHFPVVTITGPRQSGKSTLCRMVFPDKPYVNLEAPDMRAFAVEDPRRFLSQFPSGAILDEFQRAPDLASYLQVLVDEDPEHGRWILTGSEHLSVTNSVSQSLAGRSALLNLYPLSWDEVLRFDAAPETLSAALFRGAYPRIHHHQLPPDDWLSAYASLYAERDVRAFGNISDLTSFQRFMQLSAGRTGQLLNMSNLASDTGISQPTAARWFSMLEAGFIAFRLPAFSANIRKRLIRMPKLYFHDVGLAAHLIGIRAVDHVDTHPLRGALFENWVVSEVVKHIANLGLRADLSFYRDTNGVEVDLIVTRGTDRLLLEAKSGMTFHSDMAARPQRVAALLDARLAIVTGGDTSQSRSGYDVVPWTRLGDYLRSW